jgi:hydrogenase maturation protease
MTASVGSPKANQEDLAPASTLVIGLGNLDRSDDGIAFHVINALRTRLGQKPLGEDDTGLETLGARPDTIFLPQLMPDLIDVVGGYDHVIFVDAHMYVDRSDLDVRAVWPQSGTTGYAHYMTPPLMLALLKELRGREPEAHAVALRAWRLDFGHALSQQAVAMIDAAVDAIQRFC